MPSDRFTNQQPRVATEEECKAPWGGAKNGKRFRCYLCGHKFVPGDLWRFQVGVKTINFMVCEKCDGPDVVERWLAHVADGDNRFWWMVGED